MNLNFFTQEGGEDESVERAKPGAEDDGVTVLVPRDLLGMLSEADLEWLVPGMLEEKVEALKLAGGLA